jgi:acylphosphatase
LEKTIPSQVVSLKSLVLTQNFGRKTHNFFMKIARKFLIGGLVQGVGFRFFTQRAAARHQVLGYVRNLPNGRVEAFAEGNENAVEAFKHDLTTGPIYSKVEEIEETVLEPTGLYSSFRIEK